MEPGSLDSFFATASKSFQRFEMVDNDEGRTDPME
jgi:hypothetical protein